MIKNRYAFLRAKLQKKGTRSAKRLLRKRSGKEKRFVQDINHCISKKIVNSSYDTFVLEDLKGIKKKRMGRKFNTKLSGWSYFQLQTFLEYKAQAKGKHVEYVHPAYTSQTCSKCGCIDKKNRDADKYSCSSCGHEIHADINAAINIRNKFMAAVNQPHASGEPRCKLRGL